MNRAGRYSASVTFSALVRVAIVGLCVFVSHRVAPSEGKVFERCELAQLLRYGHGLDVSDVANWVCIAQHSSSFNTSAFGGNAQSGSHGLFQINDQYWCSPPGKGVACGITCDRLRDDDLSDDLDCIRIIYQEHQRLSGDGYNAWNAYQPYCRANPYEYVEDCFGDEERELLHSKSIAANSVEDEDEEDDFTVYSQRRGKVYGRCELAKELFLKHKMPMDEIPTWVCIAQHESNYDTSAVGRLNADGSADHGLFQISDLYWCSHKGGQRKACGLPCSKLLDADITDDVKCVKQIYKEHTRLSGDGFTAWTVYNAYCHGTTANYVRGCFDGIDVDEISASEEYRQVAPPKKSKKPHGKVYEPCELADELRTKHHMPEEQIATWVCIAKHESDYNTSAIGYGDHGLFQISDIYWCSPPGKGWACGLSCADLEDSDITDDVKCIRKIHNEHTRLSGDGFNAWTVYPLFCSDGRSEKYIAHCPGYHPHPSASNSYSERVSPNSIEEYPVKRGKIYGRCELAHELLEKHGMSMDEIPTWVCIAHHESNYDTSAVGRLNTDGSADHGLFQISDIYWCSHKDGRRKACGLPCSKLLDNDITDDIRCVKQIYQEHTRISGDGFTAWTVYNAYCRERTEQYVRGCFDGSASPADFNPPQRAVSRGPPPKNKPKGKVYEECELANELRTKYHMPEDQISTWVCIAKHQSGLNTSSSVSDVHGMFHISDAFWCSPPGKGTVCGLDCSDLEDSDISDDVECIRKIYLEHQRLSGNGFNAWVVFPQYCSNGRADEYIGHCAGFEALSRNSVRYPQGVINVSPQFTSRALDISNKPVYDHQFKANLFLKHFEAVDAGSGGPLSGASSSVNADLGQESFSASEEVNDVVSVSHVYSLNPFLKTFQTQEQAQTFLKTTASPPVFSAPTKTTPAAFFGFPIAPTPTTAHRVQTYQPQDEERAKNEAFKSFAEPALPPSTQTPRANRLQTYQLNTFQSLTPISTAPTIAPTTETTAANRLQSYQPTYRPTPQPFSTKTPSFNRIIPSTLTTAFFKPTTKPYVFVTPTTRTPGSSATKDSGRYDPGRYDPGRYDSGRYNSGRYDAGKYQQAFPSKTTKPQPTATTAGFHPGTAQALRAVTSAGTLPAVSLTGAESTQLPSKSVQTAAQAPSTKFYSVYSSAGRSEAPFSTSKKVPGYVDPFKPSSITATKSPQFTSQISHPFDPFAPSKVFPSAIGTKSPQLGHVERFSSIKPFQSVSETKSPQITTQFGHVDPFSSSKAFSSVTATKSPHITSQFGHVEPFSLSKPFPSAIGTKSPQFSRIEPFSSSKTFPSIAATKTLQGSSSFGHVDPFKAFSTSRTVSSGSYQSPSLSSATKSIATPSLPTIAPPFGGIKTVTPRPTAKFDPFRPFGDATRSYDPFAVFNTRKKQTSPFNDLSAKATASNEVFSTPSLIARKEIAAYSTASQEPASEQSDEENRISLTTKRETASKPSSSNSVSSKTNQEKAKNSAGASSATPESRLTKAPESSQIKVPSKRIEPTPTKSTRSAISSGLIRPTTTETLKSLPGSLSTDPRSATRSHPLITTQAAKRSSPTTSRSTTTRRPISTITTKSHEGVHSEVSTAKLISTSAGRTVSSTPTASLSPSKVAASSYLPIVPAAKSTQSSAAAVSKPTLSPTRPAVGASLSTKTTGAIIIRSTVGAPSLTKTIGPAIGASASTKSTGVIITRPAVGVPSTTRSTGGVVSRPAVGASISTKTTGAIVTRPPAEASPSTRTAGAAIGASPSTKTTGAISTRSASGASPSSEKAGVVIGASSSIKSTGAISTRSAAEASPSVKTTVAISTRSAAGAKRAQAAIGASPSIKSTGVVITRPGVGVPSATRTTGAGTGASRSSGRIPQEPSKTFSASKLTTSAWTTHAALSPTKTTTVPRTPTRTTLRPTRVLASLHTPSTGPIQTPRSSRSTRSISTSSTAAKSTISTKPLASTTREFTDLSTSLTHVNDTPASKVTRTRPNSIQIRPTKRHRLGTLFSSKLDLYEFYYKLYGVYPPTKTSSRTTQTNVIPTRTS